MAQSYVSEITQFLNELKQQNPKLDDEQIKGRSRLWDKDQDPELQEGYALGRVKQNPYVYQTKD